jgi:hypothetical protein
MRGAVLEILKGHPMRTIVEADAKVLKDAPASEQVEKTRKRLDAFEQKYGCRLEAVDKIVPTLDPLERVEWEGEAEMLRRLEPAQLPLTALSGEYTK